MSDPANTHSDNFLAFGSQVVTVGTYIAIADDISLDQPTKVLTRMNEFGVPVAEVLIEDVLTGSMTLQLPDASSVPPAIGATFTLKDVGGATVNLKVSKVGRKFSAGGETKISVDFRKRFAAGS